MGTYPLNKLEQPDFVTADVGVLYLTGPTGFVMEVDRYGYNARTLLFDPNGSSSEVPWRALTELKASMHPRIANISDLLYAAHSLRITPESSPETLDQLPHLIAALGGWRQSPDEEFELQLEGARPQARNALRHLLPRQELDEQTEMMVFDGALL